MHARGRAAAGARDEASLTMAVFGTKPTCLSVGYLVASLIGRLGSSVFRLSTAQCRCRPRARASLRNRHQGPSIMGFEDKVEQPMGRPCRQTNGRSKRPNELTSSIVPRGTSFHRSVELEFPSIAFDLVRPSCRCGFPGPPELGAVNPYAVHDHSQPACQ